MVAWWDTLVLNSEVRVLPESLEDMGLGRVGRTQMMIKCVCFTTKDEYPSRPEQQALGGH